MRLVRRRTSCPAFFVIVTALAAAFGAPIGVARCGPGSSPGSGPESRRTEIEFVECIFPDLEGVTRSPAGVTMGIPFEPGEGVLEGSNGRPQLGIDGGSRVLAWQFSDFEKQDPADPSSPVVFATLDLVLDRIASKTPLRGIYLTEGPGDSGQMPLARDLGTQIEIATGAARFIVRKNGFTFIDEAWDGNVPVVFPGSETGLFVCGADGTVYASRWGSSRIDIVRNGPACAKLRVVGALGDPSGSRTLAAYVCELTAYAGSRTLQGRLSLIAGHEQNPSDLVFDWARLVCHVAPGGGGGGSGALVVEVTKDASDGQVTLERVLGGDETLSTVQFQTDRALVGANDRYYYPALPKIDFYAGNTSSERILTGYRISLDDRSGGHTDLISEPRPDRYPPYQVMQVRLQGTDSGLTALMKRASAEYPAGISCGGSGWLALDLWPDVLPRSYAGYPLHYAVPHQYAESKEFSITVHAAAAPEPWAYGVENSYDVEGRYAHFQDYGGALYQEEGGVALAPEVQTAIYRWMGLFSPTDDVAERVGDLYWDPSHVTDHFKEVAFLEWNRSGGKYNANVQEQNILAFMRLGRCGPLLEARSYIDYVRDFQFRHLWPEGCGWANPPVDTGYPYVTSRGSSDVEHDWWRSVRLWSRLTGDDTLRGELVDHARTLSGDNDHLVYYRAWVKGLEELGLALSMARKAWPPVPADPCTGRTMAATLQGKLRDRMDDWFNRIYDPTIPYDSEGWVSPWGSLLPQSLGNPWLAPEGWPAWGTTAHLERGVRHDECYSCVDPGCGSLQSAPYGRRLFHEQLAAGSFSLCLGALSGDDDLRTELFLRTCQLGYTIMGICHWAHQTSPCGLPYPPPWSKEGDSAHIWLPPPCDQSGWDQDGPLQPREGDGQLGYAYAGQGARFVLMQYALQGNQEALHVAATKWHEILAAQRFRDSYNAPCPGTENWTNTYFDINLDDPGHWAFLWTLIQVARDDVRADFPAYNPEAVYYR